MDEANSNNATPPIVHKPRGRTSPGSEMFTLDQFLKEANKDRNKAIVISNHEEISEEVRIRHFFVVFLIFML